MSNKYKLLTFISVIIFAVLLVMTQIKKEVHVEVEVETTQLHFTLENGLSNFLAINRTGAEMGKITLASFSQVAIPSEKILDPEYQPLDSSAKTLSFQPEENDIAGKLVFTKVNPAGIELFPGNQVNITAIGNEHNQIRLNLDNYAHDIRFIPQSDTFPVKLKMALGSVGNRSFDDKIHVVNGPEILATPMEQAISMRFSFDASFQLLEEEVVSVSHVGFASTDTEVWRSGILKGLVTVDETGKKIKLTRNKKLAFAREDKFDITELMIFHDKIKVVMEGNTSAMAVGQSGLRYIPSLLEYLYKNNFLIILFNSYMVIITFFITISEKNKASLKKEAEEQKKAQANAPKKDS